jgi:hypothetical protein
MTGASQIGMAQEPLAIAVVQAPLPSTGRAARAQDGRDCSALGLRKSGRMIVAERIECWDDRPRVRGQRCKNVRAVTASLCAFRALCAQRRYCGQRTVP